MNNIDSIFVEELSVSKELFAHIWLRPNLLESSVSGIVTMIHTDAGYYTPSMTYSPGGGGQSWQHPAGVDPDTVEYTKDGERPSSWVKYALVGGSLAANLGFSAIQLGAMRLSALHHLEGTPDAVQIHVGPSPSGYGLTMRF